MTSNKGGPYGGNWRKDNWKRPHLTEREASAGRRLTPEELKSAAAQMGMSVALDRYAKTKRPGEARAWREALKHEQDVQKATRPKRRRPPKTQKRR